MRTIATASLDPSRHYFWGREKQKTDYVSLSHEEMYIMFAEAPAIRGFPTRKKESRHKQSNRKSH